MALKLAAALVVSFIVTVFIGKFLVPWLRKIKAGQEIREVGPTWHSSKAGTPTMGGVMFITGITLACLTAGFTLMAEGEFGHIYVLVFALAFGAIGFLDDYEKLKHKQNLGLTAGRKFVLQVAVAALFVFLMRRFGYLTPDLYVPFFNVTLYMSEWLFYVFAIFVIVATVNAVNLTDGVDGLASGASIPVFLFFSVTAFYWGIEYLSLGVFASAVVGGLMGFLVYNYNPAKIFMGDTGSLFLGGAVAGMAFAFDMPLIILVTGILYVIEALSDVIQVGYFKLSHGKRVFKMAPFHHHLEMGGWTGKKWSERELFTLFTGVSAVFAVLSFIGVYDRFGA
ncbi:MAG: phospho-N-acetylmuramoyl-pentapeptide-transferase [Clostridiales bacterium]|jgi:phospho-N-acetylmuramoyl-pentapeptide-transferase|nr:phospho-N-acetylmuramoyl-pentapeptide-transferase [Clostridiales bacterium]